MMLPLISVMTKNHHLAINTWARKIEQNVVGKIYRLWVRCD
jgi:hypothetical protein